MEGGKGGMREMGMGMFAASLSRTLGDMVWLALCRGACRVGGISRTRGGKGKDERKGKERKGTDL